VPEWYYLPFYAILRSIPNKLLGVVALFASILILAFLPWLDTSAVKSARYRPLYRQFFWIFVAVCIGLGWLGSKPAEGGYVIAARILTAWYFLHFIIIVPLIGLIETPKPLPDSITNSVLKGKKVGIAALIALMVAAAGLLGLPTPASAQEHEQPQPPRQKWSFAGPFGVYNPAQLQRGFQVYREVCSACHGLSLLSFRNLGDPGGPEFSPAAVEAIAADARVKDGPNDQGEMFERPGRPADRFPSPFANEQAARAANGGAAPPDMSVLAKARTYERGFPWFILDVLTQYQETGVDYIMAVLNGYEEAPAGFQLPPGTHYNVYFPGHAIGMPQPLSDGQVNYTDGSPQTVEQYSKDIAAFLMWAAEPHLDARKRLGFQVMLYLLILSGLLYFTKKKVWHDVEAPREAAHGQDPKATSI
jgi:ubiquinol-cytochrome c reductase cytochrome b/c1 subunit